MTPWAAGTIMRWLARRPGSTPTRADAHLKGATHGNREEVHEPEAQG